MNKNCLTEKEALTILKSAGAMPGKERKLYLTKTKFTYIYVADTHIGHKEFKKELFKLLIKVVKKVKPDFVLHIGDHLEGMSGRPGHVYELTHVGFKQQMEYCTELYKQISCDIYGIDGNHDEWYAKKSDLGIVVGEELDARLPNYHHLGQMEGDLIVNGTHIKLFHANDGSAYAQSYKLQKLIESITGGLKPHIIHSGHYHKSLYMFCRNVHGFESGTLCGQSKFMKGKKLQSAMGFGIVTVFPNEKGGVNRIIHEWIPYYEKDREPKQVNIK